MSKRNEVNKNKILSVLGILFTIGLGSYFFFRDAHVWVKDIIPELLGTILIGFLIIFALKQNISFKKYLIIVIFIIAIGITGYFYGLEHNIRVLIDLSPEILGSTGLSLILSLLFKKRIWQ